MIYQLKNTIDVHTPLGYGKAIAWIDYGSDTNTVWKVISLNTIYNQFMTRALIQEFNVNFIITLILAYKMDVKYLKKINIYIKILAKFRL
jgi:hypothetical protein